MCVCILRRNSRWPPIIAGKLFLGKLASRLCIHPVVQTFRRNCSISHSFPHKCGVLPRNSRWPPNLSGKRCLQNLTSGLYRYPLGLLQCFHWNRQAGNYAFLESRDQCLHGRLGSVASSRPVRESFV